MVHSLGPPRAAGHLQGVDCVVYMHSKHVLDCTCTPSKTLTVAAPRQVVSEHNKLARLERTMVASQANLGTMIVGLAGQLSDIGKRLEALEKR